MTADIDAVLSRLRERPECRDAVEVIEELRAERDRLREALALMREWCLDGEEPDGHGDLIAHVNRLLGESPVPDEDLVAVGSAEGARAVLAHVADRRESPVPDEPPGEVVPHCGAGHILLVDHDHDNPDEWWSVCGRCGVEFGPFDSHDEAAAMWVTALPAAPSHPTPVPDEPTAEQPKVYVASKSDLGSYWRTWLMVETALGESPVPDERPAVVACPSCGDDAQRSEGDEFDCPGCGFQFGSDRGSACRRCGLLDVDHVGDRHWTELGIDRDEEPLPSPVPDEPAAQDAPVDLMAALEASITEARANRRAPSHPTGEERDT